MMKPIKVKNDIITDMVKIITDPKATIQEVQAASLTLQEAIGSNEPTDEIKKIVFEDLGALSNGCHLYREPDGAGGYKYMSDEISGGINVWVTSLVPESTLLAAMCCEHNRKYQENIKKIKPEYKPSPEMQMEQCAATGGTFLPKEVVMALNEPENFDESISDWMKIRAIKCYLAYEGKKSTHNITEATAAQFDKCDDGWKNDWVRVARVSS